MRRLILLAAAAAAACDLSELPTAPSDSSTPVLPSFGFTGGSGEVLGSTNEGELVEIDLDAGTVTLIGDAGAFGGDSVGWTDIAFDGSGDLFALSRFLSESDFVPHLYEIDPSTGVVISDIGSVGDHALHDFDYASTGLHGSGRNDPVGCCGQLFTIDETNAQATWVSSDTLGFGLNPYDTVGSIGPIASGGFAVHPVTGDFWGIEALRSNEPVLYRIDPTTGVADSILRLGLGGVEAPQQFGFDGLHILDDGTFIAMRGGGAVVADSVLWEIGSVPDPVSGLAEIAVIPLTYLDTLQGHVNGLEAMGAAQGPLVVSLSTDTAYLHPWIDTMTFSTPDTLFVQDDRVGDSASVTITATLGGAPSPGATVVATAELVPGAGGHSHQADRIAFRDLPTFSYAAGGPRPVAGYFKQGSTRSDSIVATADSLGQVSFKFVAGFLGGRIDLVVNASLGGAQVADTVKLTVQVPGLVDLVKQGSLKDSVYFIGPNESHRPDSTWYAQGAFATALRSLVRQLSRPGSSEYLRLNDTSLPLGGSFNLESLLFEVSPGNEVDRPGVSHHSHAYGVDIDMSVCFSDTSGKQTGFTNPSCGASIVPVDRLWEVALSAGLIVILEGSPRHFHLRLGSETLRVPK